METFFLKALNKLDLLKKINVNGKLSLNKKTFSIPIIKSNGYNNLFMSEVWMVELLSKLLQEKKIHEKKFIDIGVNIGQTLIKLRSVSNEMNYIGFEPNPLCIFYTNELIKVNPTIKNQNTLLLPVGISTKDEILTLNMYSENEMDASASIIEEFRKDHEIKLKTSVPVFSATNIDNNSNVLKNVGIIKIDVEGAELEVLTSLKDVLKKERPIILIEILPIYKSENEFRIKRQIEIESIFNDLNYSIYRVKKKKNDSFSNLKKIETIEIHSNLDHCDYVISPNEYDQLNDLIS